MSKSAPDTTTKDVCLEDSEAGTQRHSEAKLIHGNRDLAR